MPLQAQTSSTSNHHLLEPSQQNSPTLHAQDSTKSQSGTGHGLEAIHDENESITDVSESSRFLTSATLLNIRHSPKLGYPDLSFCGTTKSIEPLYPLLPILKDNAVSVATVNDDQSSLITGSGSAASYDDEPFRTPLGFHIPRHRLQEAIDAPSTSIAAYWQYTLYQGPEGEKDKVKVHYCKTTEASERVAHLFLDEEVLGFDIEWKGNAAAAEGIAKNVALIQLASERRVALFHVARYSDTNNVEDFAVPTLKKVMESDNITKVGVAVKGDCTRLRKFLNIEPRGVFELSHLYKLVKYSSGDVKKINKTLVSLAQQVREHLKLPLWKGDVRTSDWSHDLDYEQIKYAASDSYAGFHLYHVLEAERKAIIPTPPRPAHAELNLPIRLADGQTVAAWSEPSTFVEELDEEPNEESSEESVSSTNISVEELARDFMNINIEDPNPQDSGPTRSAKSADIRLSKHPVTGSRSSSLPSTSSSSTGSKPNPHASAPKKPPAPCVTRASEWVTDYINSLPAGRKAIAKPADLRAYYLWHHEEYSAHEIARSAGVHQGKDLGLNTVVGYIFNAIRSEDLPFVKHRAWALVPYGHKLVKGGYMALIMSRYPPKKKDAEANSTKESLGKGNEAQVVEAGEDEGATK